MDRLWKNSSVDGVCAEIRRHFPTATSGFQFVPDMVFRILYLVVIIVSLTLNTVVVYALKKKAIKNSSLKSLLLSLAFADIFTSLGMCPYVMVSTADLANYNQGVADFLCSITFGQTLFWIGNSASVFTLCIISVHRYIVIKYPARAWKSILKDPRYAIGAAVFVWILGTLLIVPNFCSRRFIPCLRICPRQWPAGFDGAAYAITTTFIGYITPVVILFYTFCATLYTMWLQKTDPGANKGTRKIRKRVLTLLGILIFVFSVCWSPFAVYWILSRATDFFPEGVEGHYSRTRANHVVILVALCNSVINPLVYGLFSPRMKEFWEGNSSSGNRQRINQSNVRCTWDYHPSKREIFAITKV